MKNKSQYTSVVSGSSTYVFGDVLVVFWSSCLDAATIITVGRMSESCFGAVSVVAATLCCTARGMGEQCCCFGTASIVAATEYVQ